LVGRGIRERERPKGQILARFQNERFCFTNSVNAIKLREIDEWRYLSILGILWSSLARYHFFLTSSAWGLWHNELHLEEILALPIRFHSIVDPNPEIPLCVEMLRSLPENAYMDDSIVRHYEKWLDNAVFDLYELSEPERDLVKDMCDVAIPFFYDSQNSQGAHPIVLDCLNRQEGMLFDLDEDPNDRLDVRGYLRAFLRIWNREVEPDGEFSWRVIAPGNPAPMLAVVFSTLSKGAKPMQKIKSDEQAWENLLEQLAKGLRVPFHSDRVYVDGLVRAVSPSQIIIIKRNEGRFWTRSAAREDAEATLLEAMHLDDANGELV
jgi:hypothetical protein